MKFLGVDEVIELASHGFGPCVSIFVDSRSNRGSHDSHQEKIRRYSQYAGELIHRSFGSELAAASEVDIFAGLTAGIRQFGGICHSVAFFWTVSGSAVVPLPIATGDWVVAARKFHLKPLIEARERFRAFIALVIGKSSVEAYHVRPAKMLPISTAPVRVRQGEHHGVAHSKIKSLCRSIRKRVDSEGLQLMVATESDSLNEASDIVGGHLLREPVLRIEALSKWSRRSLAQQLRQAMEPFNKKRLSQSMDRLHAASSASQSVYGIARVAMAISEQRTQEIFVAREPAVWGHFDTHSGEIRIHSGQQDACDGDVLSELARVGLEQNIPVHVIPHSAMPRGSVAAAITY